MGTISVSRTIAAEPDAVRDVFADVETFMREAGYDTVDIAGDRVTIERSMGLADLQLTLEIRDTEAAFAYEQVEGLFEAMTTTYRLEAEDGATTVTAETEFELGDAVGDALEPSMIERQRTNELQTQLAYLEDAATDAT